MRLNADFTKRAVVHAASVPWIASPMKGVERRMLDRIGDEVARATSIVRYAPGSHFSAHNHDGGEEFLVLEGTFQDEHGDYPAGTYVRNPPGTSHTPGAEDGCTILVKLWQFDPDDRNQFSRDSTAMDWIASASQPGVEKIQLHTDARETVRMERWASGTTINHEPEGGAEILVLEGSFQESDEAFSTWSWLRLPPGAPLRAVAGPEGCKVWVKEGHLADIQQSPLS
ncbi:MAG: cupin domain-containing protein [Rhizobiaceae bacterium]